ncbi:MAG: hypothetical protein V3S14_02710 [Anaerolineae bacterium]
MTKLRVLALLAVVALVLFPAVAMAQGPGLPNRFHGTVLVDGLDVADGTVITATIDGDEYTATTPSAYGDSTYALEIAPAVGTAYTEGAEITFMIGDQSVEQTGAWEAGGNAELNLRIGVGGPVINGGGITRVIAESLPAGSAATVTLINGVLTIGIPDGDTGPAGTAGSDGSAGSDGGAGPAGEKGEDSPIVIPIIALVLAIVSIVVAISVMRRKV